MGAGGYGMQILTEGAQGLGLVVRLNWDRALYLMTIGAALWLGAFVGSL